MAMTFQQELARKLFERYSGDLSSLTILFPSLRARTFFNNALSELYDKPCWQPHWRTIDEIMEGISKLERGDRFRLIAELYKVYIKYHPNEKFDKFYFWGEMLIADFDLIDKYMVDAKQLLRNIEDIKELEADVSYLTEEQLRIISFWKSIGDGETLSEQKLRFLEIWKTLPYIYEEYRKHLTSLGIGYTGMIYRRAIEKIDSNEEVLLPKSRFVIAGFNALSECEKRLFTYLRNSDKGAEFYWDYDNYYVANKSHEAGMFMRENLKLFPADYGITSTNFSDTPKSIRVAACVSNVVQCKYVAKVLESLGSEAYDKRTVIVLTDENMLIPMLHSIPQGVEHINVTMGYPLKNTLAYSLVERLLELQQHSRQHDDSDTFYHVDVHGILSHPYIVDCCGEVAHTRYSQILENRITMVEGKMFENDAILNSIFCKHDDWMSIAKYLLDVISQIIGLIDTSEFINIEYLRIVHDELAKVMHSIESCGLNVPTNVFTSLLRRHMQTITMPYEGEPLEGLQVMGILETRNVDFENVILLSMNDANFPSDKTGQSSFIPYNLRAAYGIPTPEHHEAMYAYYFYRLIQRAKSVTMIYCSRADDKSTGECSRYIHQLEYESPYKVDKLSIGVDLSVDEVEPISVAKGEYEQSILNKYLDAKSSASLSPTALFRYVECPLKFYLHSVAKLRIQDEVSDTIDALMFGNILHESMQELYTPLIGEPNPMQHIADLRKRKVVEEVVDKTISRLIHRSETIVADKFSGDTILVRDIIVKYILRGVLRYDAQRSGFTIHGLEDDVECSYPISNGRHVNLSGRADRIDRRADGSLQIIDYKSGNVPHLNFNGIEGLFRGSAEERISNIFQTMLYSMMLNKKHGTESMPSLYFASKMMSDDYSPNITDISSGEIVERYSMVATEFESELSTILEELFDYSKPFVQCDDVDMCKYCDFKSICRR